MYMRFCGERIDTRASDRCLLYHRGLERRSAGKGGRSPSSLGAAIGTCTFLGVAWHLPLQNGIPLGAFREHNIARQFLNQTFENPSEILQLPHSTSTNITTIISPYRPTPHFAFDHPPHNPKWRQRRTQQRPLLHPSLLQ